MVLSEGGLSSPGAHVFGRPQHLREPGRSRSAATDVCAVLVGSRPPTLDTITGLDLDKRLAGERLMELDGRRVAVLAEDMYEDLELLYPLYRLQEAGAEVVVVGPEAKTYPSKHGYPVTANRSSREISAEEFDAVIVPGGYAPD